MSFFSNWTVMDLVRSLGDRATKGGTTGLGSSSSYETEGLQVHDLDPTKSHQELSPTARLAIELGEAGRKLHDFRLEKRAGRGAAHGVRAIDRVTAIMWHQSAAVLGKPERYMGVPCHAAVMRNGDVVLLHQLRALVWHGHTGNSFSVGVEIDCRAAGVEGDARTFWRSRREKADGKTYTELVREPTDVQLKAAFLLGVYITEEIERLGGAIKAQMFHRNAHSSRTSDPGSRIALNVAWPLAQRYGHEYGGPVVGSGHPTRAEWYPKEKERTT